MNIDFSRYSDGNYFSNIMHSAMLLGQVKNKAWITKLIHSKFFINDLLSNTRKARYAQTVCLTIDAYNEKYGDDWDIFLYLGSDLYNRNVESISFVHLYTNLEIKNSLQQTHNIKDLYVINTLDSDICFMKPKGTRFSLTGQEIHGQYLHSHLNSKTFRDYWSRRSSSVFDSVIRFCIGEGENSDIDIVRYSLNFNISEEIVEVEEIVLYLFALDSFVQWESLEGGPYMKIKDLPSKVSAKSYESYQARHVSETIIEYKKNRPDFILPMDFYISENRYMIRNNLKLLESIKQAIKYLYFSGWQNHFVKFNPMSNRYYSFTESTKTVAQVTIPDNAYMLKQYTLYRGQKKCFRIIKNKALVEETENINNYTIHPEILTDVINKLESYLYKQSIKFSRVKKENTLNNS